MAADSKSASSLRSLPQLLLNLFSVQYNLKITSFIHLLFVLFAGLNLNAMLCAGHCLIILHSMFCNFLSQFQMFFVVTGRVQRLFYFEICLVIL